jgi:hypothetical protein
MCCCFPESLELRCLSDLSSTVYLYPLNEIQLLFQPSINFLVDLIMLVSICEILWNTLVHALPSSQAR